MIFQTFIPTVFRCTRRQNDDLKTESEMTKMTNINKVHNNIRLSPNIDDSRRTAITIPSPVIPTSHTIMCKFKLKMLVFNR